MARRVTDTDQKRRWWTADFLKRTLAETGLTLYAVAHAYRGAGRGDVRSAVRRYRDGVRTISAVPAFALGEAFRQCGVLWLNGGVSLYACGHFGEWVRYVECLRRHSYPAAMVATFAPPVLGNPMTRAMAEPAAALPEHLNAEILMLFRESPRAHLARLTPDILDPAANDWTQGKGMGGVVTAALLLDDRADVNWDLREKMCVSLAVASLAAVRVEDDINAIPLYTALYEAYFRRIPLFRPDRLQVGAFAPKADLNTDDLDQLLEPHFRIIAR